jgi:hypothetical protein
VQGGANWALEPFITNNDNGHRLMRVFSEHMPLWPEQLAAQSLGAALTCVETLAVARFAMQLAKHRLRALPLRQANAPWAVDTGSFPLRLQAADHAPTDVV